MPHRRALLPRRPAPWNSRLRPWRNCSTAIPCPQLDGAHTILLLLIFPLLAPINSRAQAHCLHVEWPRRSPLLPPLPAHGAAPPPRLDPNQPDQHLSLTALILLGLATPSTPRRSAIATVQHRRRPPASAASPPQTAPYPFKTIYGLLSTPPSFPPSFPMLPWPRLTGIWPARSFPRRPWPQGPDCNN